MRFLFRNFWRARRLSLVLSGLYQFTLSLSLDSFQFMFGTLPSSYRELDYLLDLIHHTNNLERIILSRLSVNPDSSRNFFMRQPFKMTPSPKPNKQFLNYFGKLPLRYCKVSLTTKIYSNIKNLPFVRLSV
jgi:hypothetical protein